MKLLYFYYNNNKTSVSANKDPVANSHELIIGKHASSGGGSDSEWDGWIDEIIQRRFSDKTRERRWRAGHSDRFISKVNKVAKFLRIPIRDLLFKC